MAIYCPDIPLTFVHIPKTAGSAVSSWLKTHAHGTDYMPLTFGSKHWEFSKIHRHMRNRRLNPGIVVVVVRNPYDRLVSTWAYYRRRRKSWCPENFRDFVLNTSWGNAKRLQTSFFKFSETIQSETIVLRFENLATDFRQIQSLCTVALNDTAINDSPLTIKNKSEHEHYSSYYDAETINAVQKRHGMDLRLLGYNFDKQSI